MNKLTLAAVLAGVILATTPHATAGLPVSVYGRATVSESHVILDVFTDTNGFALRGFGIEVLYDPSALSFDSGGRYDGLWFLRGENGIVYPYTDVTLPDSKCVRVIGGRLDGNNPAAGVGGSNLLLATLIFKRGNAEPPVLSLGFASPDPYVNFASADGESLDSIVKFEEEIVIQPASEDSDGDGLPDDHEIAAYGDLTTSDGTTDTDGDGDNDADEWLRGTDPTDPNSSFDLQIVPQPDGSKLLLWTGELERVYDVEWSRTLESFDLIGVGLPGLAPVVDLLDELHNQDPEGFYRVKTRYPTLGR